MMYEAEGLKVFVLEPIVQRVEEVLRKSFCCKVIEDTAFLNDVVEDGVYLLQVGGVNVDSTYQHGATSEYNSNYHIYIKSHDFDFFYLMLDFLIPRLREGFHISGISRYQNPLIEELKNRLLELNQVDIKDNLLVKPTWINHEFYDTRINNFLVIKITLKTTRY